MKGQLYLDTGYDKVTTALLRIIRNDPCGKYKLAFGGGKDSIVVYSLASEARKRAGVNFEPFYAQTGIDPPELVDFIRRNYDVQFYRPKMTMWKGIEKKGLPTRRKRWCCEYLKHFLGRGEVTITGIRWAESPRRKKYGEISYLGKDKVVNPIIDWTNLEVWDYIKSNNLPYCSLYDNGFTRLGCLVCPMTQRKNRLREAELYPKIAEAYKRANRRFYLSKDRTAEEADTYFEEWINYP